MAARVVYRVDADGLARLDYCVSCESSYPSFDVAEWREHWRQHRTARHLETSHNRARPFLSEAVEFHAAEHARNGVGHGSDVETAAEAEAIAYRAERDAERAADRIGQTEAEAERSRRNVAEREARNAERDTAEAERRARIRARLSGRAGPRGRLCADCGENVYRYRWAEHMRGHESRQHLSYVHRWPAAPLADAEAIHDGLHADAAGAGLDGTDDEWRARHCPNQLSLETGDLIASADRIVDARYRGEADAPESRAIGGGYELADGPEADARADNAADVAAAMGPLDVKRAQLIGWADDNGSEAGND